MFRLDKSNAGSAAAHSCLWSTDKRVEKDYVLARGSKGTACMRESKVRCFAHTRAKHTLLYVLVECPECFFELYATAHQLLQILPGQLF